MSPTQNLNHPDTGSRLHFVLAAAVAILISVGLTSTAAMAGLAPVTDAPSLATPFATEFDGAAEHGAASAGMQLTRASYQPAVIATPALIVSAGVASDLAMHPYLEEEQEFAPKFQHVVTRTRAGQRNVLSQLGCALFAARGCAHPTGA